MLWGEHNYFVHIWKIFGDSHGLGYTGTGLIQKISFEGVV